MILALTTGVEWLDEQGKATLVAWLSLKVLWAEVKDPAKKRALDFLIVEDAD